MTNLYKVEFWIGKLRLAIEDNSYKELRELISDCPEELLQILENYKVILEES